MKTLARVFIPAFMLVFSFTLLVSAQEATAPDASSGTPKIVFDQLSHNFGDVSPDKITKYKFVFHNNGQGVLHIISVHSSCGCTAVVPAKKVLDPGESSVLEVQYHAARYAGPIRKVVTVQSDDPENPKISLEITATVVTDLEYSPPSLRFQNVVLGKPLEQTIFFKPKNPDTFKISDIFSDPNYLTCKLNKLEDGRLRLDVVLNPDPSVIVRHEYGNTMIRITNNSEAFPVISIPVFFRLQKEFSAIPQRLLMFPDARGEHSARDLVIKNNKGENFKIIEVKSSNPYIHAAITTNDVTANVVSVSIDPQAPKGSCNGILTVVTDRSQLTVPVRARVK